MAGRAARQSFIFLVTLLCIVLASSGARAQDDVPVFEPESEDSAPARTPPPTYIVDLSNGLRVDSVSTLGFSQDRKHVLIGTDQGKAYSSTTEGKLWMESTVIPETKHFFGDAGQRRYIGALRTASSPRPGAAGLSSTRSNGIGTTFGLGGMPTMASPWDVLGLDEMRTPHFPFDRGQALPRDYANPRALDARRRRFDLARFGQPVLLEEGLESESRAAAAGTKFALVTGGQRAPYLQRYIESLKRPASTASIKKITSKKGVRGTAVVWIHDVGGTFYAATGDGLFRSNDNATTWLKVFPGATDRERFVNSIASDPRDPRRMFIATGAGLFESTDGGDSWTKVGGLPGFWVRHVTFDPKDPRYVYAAVAGGIWRSADGGATFSQAFFSTLKARGDVFYLAIDKNDPNRAFAGTRDGMLFTDHLRTATDEGDWTLAAGLRTGNLAFGKVAIDPSNPEHIYAMTGLDLRTISYRVNAPQSYLLESWDGGKTWTILMSGRTQGVLRWFKLDPRDPSVVWTAWTGGVFRIHRKPPRAAKKARGRRTGPLDLGPPLTAVMQAAMAYHKIGLDDFSERIEKVSSSKWWPSALTVIGQYRRYGTGAFTEDIQFIGDRFRFGGDRDDLMVFAFATWNLPEAHFAAGQLAMRRDRVQRLADEVRGRILRNVHRNYGELQRLWALQQTEPDADLRTRVFREVRTQQLTAVIDLVSGGYLSNTLDQPDRNRTRRNQ